MQTKHYKNSFFFIIFAPKSIYTSFQVKLHIFNPEHDIALGYDKSCMTLPHAIQELKMNLGFLPALWAGDGDCVLVDDVPFALKALRHIRKPHADVLFLTKDGLGDLSFTEVEPWGWDMRVRAELCDAGVNCNVLPDDRMLLKIRGLSSRRQSLEALHFLRRNLEYVTCGESFYADNADEVDSLFCKYGRVVLKAPWSSSGRGIRYVPSRGMCDSVRGWMLNIIRSQGGIMVEPYYNRIRDFAMEFYSDGGGGIEYRGLSVFNTEKGSYTGNVIASEDDKNMMIGKYVPEDLLSIVKQRVIEYFSSAFSGAYRGPFGVDMMIVVDGCGCGFLLHPCVETNVRMTMGHVANSFGRTANEPVELMRIVHDVNYKLRFDAMENNFVKTI